MSSLRLHVQLLVCLHILRCYADEMGNDCSAESSLLQRKQERRRDRLNTETEQLQVPQYLEVRQGIAFMNVTAPYLSHFSDELLQKMVVPPAIPCEALRTNDQRRTTCGTETVADGLYNPRNLSNTSRNPSTIRLHMPLGALPCCPAPPYCRAPACKFPSSPVLTTGTGTTCTKFPPEVNYRYMTHPQVWPAYYGAGGSYDLDVEKHWDVLGLIFGCSDVTTRNCRNGEPFDLAIDLGADFGTTTERLSVRNFARHFVLVDAFPGNRQLFLERLGNNTYVDDWYKHIPGWPGKRIPRFEFHNYAVGNTTDAVGVLDLCDGRYPYGPKEPCPAQILTVDAIIPDKLSPDMKTVFASAQNAYLKIDVEGMDQAAIDGMRRLLGEVRGTYADGNARYLVDFMMLEFCPSLMAQVQKQKNLPQYDLGTLVKLIESIGFEVFLIGPRYLPLSHGSWTEKYNNFTKSPSMNSPMNPAYAGFHSLVCPGNWCREGDFMTADLFAMRSTHPRATEIKLALGACVESRDFDVHDPQYIWPSPQV